VSALAVYTVNSSGLDRHKIRHSASPVCSRFDDRAPALRAGAITITEENFRVTRAP
jgi:hypothetical protein